MQHGPIIPKTMLAYCTHPYQGCTFNCLIYPLVMIFRDSTNTQHSTALSTLNNIGLTFKV